ncbi:MAG: hypothetical protein KJ065_24940 [Anaerolineae bacterium]|nr:hypothetical protein [Anaerolineae bacterium]
MSMVSLILAAHHLPEIVPLMRHAGQVHHRPSGNWAMGEIQRMGTGEIFLARTAHFWWFGDSVASAAPIR